MSEQYLCLDCKVPVDKNWICPECGYYWTSQLSEIAEAKIQEVKSH